MTFWIMHVELNFFSVWRLCSVTSLSFNKRNSYCGLEVLPQGMLNFEIKIALSCNAFAKKKHSRSYNIIWKKQALKQVVTINYHKQRFKICISTLEKTVLFYHNFFRVLIKLDENVTIPDLYNVQENLKIKVGFGKGEGGLGPNRVQKL